MLERTDHKRRRRRGVGPHAGEEGEGIVGDRTGEQRLDEQGGHGRAERRVRERVEGVDGLAEGADVGAELVGAREP